jgi:hypothetical protein
VIFAIPYNIPSQNVTTRRHWRANHRDVARVAQMVRLVAWQICNAKGPRSVVVTSYRKQRITDAANIIGGAKSFIDGLVKAGALVDDNDRMASIAYRQAVLSQLPEEWARKYGRRPLTVIEITDQTTAAPDANPSGKE